MTEHLSPPTFDPADAAAAAARFAATAHPDVSYALIDSPVGTLRALVPPATFVGSSPVAGPIPDVGEHTETVLAEFGVRADVARVR